MVEELSLPILPPPLPATHPLTRKRCLEYDPSSSSDPPLFSSDDHGVLLDPDESVQDGPRKRRYRGTWWGAEPNSRKEPFRVRTKRNFKRNMDSGVWLGSEDSQLSEGESSVLADTPRQPSGETQTPSEDNVTTSAVRRASGPCERLAETQDLPTMYAERIVQRCLEEGDECIDLSGLALPDLPPALVKSMLYMTKHPDSSQIPPSQGSYTSLRPCLSLFLSRNLLQTVPGEVFHLEHLTVLSLRNNGLTELPSAIRRLVNLVELNVGGNQLQWLPYDLLGLLGPQKKLKTLSVFPNPFFNPAELPNFVTSTGLNAENLPQQSKGHGSLPS
ncbi:MAG: hypothetical protein M1817_004661 [Caeruleum heppii]|nr:MAG: hypothetical protein M1817_004661 [Caeruleum heppii]